ncbi:hypothetical protein Palpr_0179 [Paludibacter propionicigenes WB4]|uniref:CRISPR-associated endoribonuclease Cas13a n=1 Tax=Paludibacter propionicigenes (strain DSM 17365 / JCM 13257 / WB4) TaxID=694427 RepID=CS13A_PALPW|nr:type VI-A CRISPR-associated RNA-guided ribonuclease Cas13a [Paludibacter propionicigenes]E4T0I2.1 RecName: Full=CRISPR-associated endoribonuclease Cas13a; Short=EndoRNase; AltName: Full=PprCas13a [Paludibacter propionicigenes WB4]ADQ78341.1 hypothetical protein Palpr_0179 [Paludibacter propionicigenes WB4]
MRVSKVKVKDGGKDKMVLVHRKTTGAQLVYSGQPVSNETSNILPEKKRQSFDLSTLNKTIIKFDTAKKQKLNVDQYKIVEKIFKYPKQELPKQIKAEEILPFLNHKFQEPVKYWKNGKEESFNLTLLIVEAVQAQDKRKLQPYYDWKTWYIQTKSDLLKKSIENNRIDLTENLSKRKKALLAWETEFTASGSIDLTHYHKVYMTDVLCKMLQDVKPLTDDKGKINTNAYHRGLKKALQNHQPAIFGTREVPNEANRADNQLSIYHLEVVKYLEHYFPIKTSKRRNTADDIAHYLKAQTLKTTIEKQLVNAIRANIIQQGKTNHHELKADTTSNDLIRIKTNEAFVLNLTGTCAFAANNIRNMVDNEQTNDILGKGDFIKSLLKDNTNSQLYSFFFGEGLSTNKAEKETQLWGIRGAVQQIRNNVNHYKKDALKTVFNISNFENPTITDPKQQTNYADTIYKARFINELEKIPEAFAQQLKTGGAVSYYTIENLKSLLTTFQFSLCRSTIPFAPGFKKVFNGGINYQNAKQDESFYELMLEQYLRKENFAEESYNARYFMLKLIYNNLFLPGFTTDRKAFADSVGFVQMQNKKQAEKVNPRKKEAYAFEAVRPMTAADSIADYMAYVQSELMQEQNKKEEKVAEETRINFEKFVLQVFIKGFDSFLRAKEFDFVQMPQPQLTATASNQQKADKLNQLEASITADCKLTPQYAKADDATHIAFYVFCKLLDAAHLSNLRNELIKFRESVNEFKFHHLLEIIEICLLSADVVPTDYRDLYSSEADCLARLRPFIEQGADITNWSDLFVQSDKHSPVIHANIELSVKYGTTKLLEQIINKDTQFKTTEANFTAWNTAQKSIEQLIKQREDHHEQWVKAKNADDKEKQERKREKSNFAQKFIEKHGDDYLDICDYINTYNWLDNKMHFVHLNRLHGLTIELLGRMAGFVALFDRDFQFFDEQQIADEFKLHGFVNLHSIDKKLNEVPTKKIKEIYDIRNKIIQINGNKINESVRANLIQFISSKRNYYNNAFLHVSNDEIKEKQMYDIRNHIAHFNYLTKDAADFSLIDLINELRELLHYDRKLKNAVSKAFIDLFDKHGMILKLKLNADHKLKVESLEPKKIYHLGSSAKDKPEYQYCTNQVMMAYCNMCRSLLEMKK